MPEVPAAKPHPAGCVDAGGALGGGAPGPAGGAPGVAAVGGGAPGAPGAAPGGPDGGAAPGGGSGCCATAEPETTIVAVKTREEEIVRSVARIGPRAVAVRDDPGSSCVPEPSCAFGDGLSNTLSPRTGSFEDRTDHPSETEISSAFAYCPTDSRTTQPCLPSPISTRTNSSFCSSTTTFAPRESFATVGAFFFGASCT